MPWKPKTICCHADCNELCNDSYCDKHKKQVTRERNKSSSKIYTYQWRKASKAYLKENPLCTYCQKENRLTPATEVDHIIPHNGDMKLFWDQNNWQSLCKTCHSKKTALEDGGFGNRPRTPEGTEKVQIFKDEKYFVKNEPLGLLLRLVWRLGRHF